MKKLILTLIAFVFIILSFSCKKDSKINDTSDAFTIAKIIDGHISFTNKISYENYLSASDRKAIVNSFPGIKDFLSYKNRSNNGNADRQIGNCEVPDSLIEDNTAFFDLLDANGVLQIGDYLYRYDYCNDKTWVISVSDDSNSTYHTNFMNGTETTGIVGSFPNYVDVLEAIAQGYITMPPPTDTAGNEIFQRITIGTIHLEHCYINNNEENVKGQNVKMDGKLSYEKFGIYFNFYAKEKYQTSCLFNWCTSSSGRRDWYVFYWFQCKRKGQSEWITGQGNLYPPVSGSNQINKTFYEGSRGLNWGDGVWKVKDMWTNKNRVQRNQGSGWNQIVNDSYSSFGYHNNYQFNSGTNQYEIHFY